LRSLQIAQQAVGLPSRAAQGGALRGEIVKDAHGWFLVLKFM